MRNRWVPAALALAFALTACGSTVQPQGEFREFPTAVGAGDVESTPAGNDEFGAAPVGAPESRSAAPRTATSRSATATRAGTVAASGRDGPGVGDRTITIGFVYPTNNDVAQAALGNTVATAGDVKGEAEAVLRDINAKGGAKGRRIDAVFHPVDATSTATAAEHAASICANFTEDNKVLAAVNTLTRDLTECLEKAGVAGVGATLSAFSDEQYAQLPLYYDVQSLSTTVAMRNMVEELAVNGYFSGWNTATGQPGAAPTVVGVLVPDLPQWNSVVGRVLLPALAAKGIRVRPEHVHRWHFPESTSGNAQAVAEINSSVLRFRSDRVTHILPLEVNSLGFFAQPAESQGYRPRYGLNSATSAQTYAGSLVPYAQLNGAIGIGWTPALDLPASTNQEGPPYAGPGRARCLKVYAEAGFTFSDPSAKAVGLVICDALYSLRDALNAIPSGTAINAVSLLRAVESLGNRFAIAGLPSATFAPGKHYAVDGAWRWAFDSACPCMKYVGARYALR